MEKAVQILLGVIVVLIVIVGAVLVFMPDDQTVKKVTGHAVKVQEKGPIKIGVSLPLTGEGASYGESITAGIELAVKEINDAGGVDGRELVLFVEDDKCTAKEGVTAMNKLVNVDGVDVVVGSICSGVCSASLPVAQQSGTPVIFWGSAPRLTGIGDYVFRTYPSDSFQGSFAAEFVFDELGKRKAAVLYVQNDWGQGLEEVFVQRFEELGGEVVFDEGVAQDAKDFRSVIAKLKAADPDMIYVPLYPATGINAVRQVKESGLDVLMIGGDAFESDEFFKSGVAEGVMFTIAEISNPDDFKERVTQVTGKSTNAFTSTGYDSVHIFASVIEEVGTDKEAIRDALQDLHYTEAVALPLVEFDSRGDLATAEFSVMVVEDSESVPLDG